MENRIVLVDTSVFIEFFRKSNKEQTVLYAIDNNTTISISTVTVFELLAGATDLKKWNDTLQLIEGVPMLAFTNEIAKNAAKLFQKLKQNNALIEFRDIFIAATAIANNIPLITLNKKHFQRIEGLEIL